MNYARGLLCHLYFLDHAVFLKRTIRTIDKLVSFVSFMSFCVLLRNIGVLLLLEARSFGSAEMPLFLRKASFQDSMLFYCYPGLVLFDLGCNITAFQA